MKRRKANPFGNGQVGFARLIELVRDQQCWSPLQWLWHTITELRPVSQTLGGSFHSGRRPPELGLS